MHRQHIPSRPNTRWHKLVYHQDRLELDLLVQNPIEAVKRGRLDHGVDTSWIDRSAPAARARDVEDIDDPGRRGRDRSSAQEDL